MKHPFISVLVPIYGVEKYIGRCFDSLLSQTYKDFEIVFVDDCTPDASIDIIRQRMQSLGKLDIDIKIIKNEHNKGLATTRNVGLENAVGEYVCFVDSDDYITSDSLHLLANIAISCGADIVKGNYARVCNKKVEPKYFSYPSETKDYCKAILDWGKIAPRIWGGIYKKSLFTDNKISFPNELDFGEDLYASAHICYFATKIIHIKEIVYNYWINPDSYCSVYKEKNAISLIENYERICSFYKQYANYSEFEESINRGRAKIKISILAQLNSQLRPQYYKLWNDEISRTKLPLNIAAKLIALEHGCYYLYRVIYKLFH